MSRFGFRFNASVLSFLTVLNLVQMIRRLLSDEGSLIGDGATGAQWQQRLSSPIAAVRAFGMMANMTENSDGRNIQLTIDSPCRTPAWEVEALYAAASEGPPLNESRDVARMFATLYSYAQQAPGTVTVEAHQENDLVGFAYGRPWNWDDETDEWSLELRHRLGTQANELDETFAVELLAVHPSASGAGLGRRLLTRLLEQTKGRPAWLQTTDFLTPAMKLYLSSGWEELGHGPKAPNGQPGLIMIKRP